MATLVTPLLTIQSAQAVIPKSDLSITKTVTGLGPTIEFDPAMSATRATGHFEFVEEGLHIWTESNSSTDKVAEYVDAATPLADVAAAGDPALEYTSFDGDTPPGFQLVVDLDGNGSKDGILVGEGAYNGRWWLADLQSSTPDLSAAPGAADGYDHAGLLSAWSTAFPSARVIGFGFSLGSGVFGDGILTAFDFAGERYSLARTYSSSIHAAPGETVKYKLEVANSSNPGTLTADNVTISDALPPELTYVTDSLVDNDNGCSFSGQTLTCNAGSFPAGISSTVTFEATLDDQISTANLGTTPGHNVDVQKQEVFADLPAGETNTFAVQCPDGYLPTDGGLLIDAVDQGGFYSDISVTKSEATSTGWTVTATNLGDQRGQGKVKVTCLGKTLGSVDGHTHTISSSTVPYVRKISAGMAEGSTSFTLSCASGETPIAPVYRVLQGNVAVTESYAVGPDWHFTAQHGDATKADFGISCLAPTTSTDNGHAATLSLSTADDTISVAPDSRAEGVQQCPDNGNAIVGGYAGYDSSVLFLGKEPRGNNYMFRFHNEDWENAWDADIQVTCAGVRTVDEPTYYHVRNTAVVTTTTKDRNTSDNSSTADVGVAGDPAAPAASGLQVNGGTGELVTQGSYTKSVKLSITCGLATACSFTAKVVTDAGVVAKKTTSLAAGATKNVFVPTTSLGQHLGAGPATAKLKSSSGLSTFPITLS